MLMSKGQLITTSHRAEERLVNKYLAEMTATDFTPSYVQSASEFGRIEWLKKFLYFRLRGLAFRVISVLEGDTKSLHYLDAQAWLPHKASLRDIEVLDLQDHDWQQRLSTFPIHKRVFIGLTVFPEASIDYWVGDPNLIDYEKSVLEIVKDFSNSGYLVLIKDHPQQFGFRQIGFIQKLLTIENVTFVPYSVSGRELLENCGINFSYTGTLGLQAALAGKTSVVVENYYSSPTEFVEISKKSELKRLVGRVASWTNNEEQIGQRKAVIENLVKGSFECDFFSFVGFDQRQNAREVSMVGRQIIAQLDNVGLI